MAWQKVEKVKPCLQVSISLCKPLVCQTQTHCGRHGRLMILSCCVVTSASERPIERTLAGDQHIVGPDHLYLNREHPPKEHTEVHAARCWLSAPERNCDFRVLEGPNRVLFRQQCRRVLRIRQTEGQHTRLPNAMAPMGNTKSWRNIGGKNEAQTDRSWSASRIFGPCVVQAPAGITKPWPWRQPTRKFMHNIDVGTSPKQVIHLLIVGGTCQASVIILPCDDERYNQSLGEWAD